ncbi:hypothetical protein IMSHALPRED_003380 [Imshaugia aleurites]|uniref:Uncharacterized protein n=1 Tax=Imshaugia aleurites TaxID=172621 RepID=A0A8H3J7C3_9LECA|nr:hypothetical protein IMSHALPRED_003380 [Imshaugia aleurites]
MPVRAPLDCLTIGAAFLGMPRLADLTITDLCDSQAFVEEFRHLGDGILALSSSLRSLVIEITNCNRAEGWEQDKAFVEPGDSAFLFKAFFPEPSCKRIETLIRARYDDPREPLDVNIFRSSQGQLNLEHIRLKHIGLPWWSFQTVFNSRTIKGLDLPMCRVTPSVWDDLGKHAQLHKLANIDYEMFSGTPALMSFLSTQSRLQILSFKRPPDLYQIAGTTSLDHGQADSTSFSVKEAAPHLGLGTEWGRAHARDAWLLQSSKSWIQHEYLIQSPSSWIYFDNLIRSLSPYIDYQYPKKSDFVKILSDKLLLRHLIIPADMFDVTPSFMACLAGELPALESIELGFDYACPRLCECFIKDFLPSHPQLKKVTFLSLNRPHPLSDFNAKHMHAVFEYCPYNIAPASLKYVRYRDLNEESHKGEHTESDVYYHRETMANGTWWLKIPAREEEKMFEDDRTPIIYAIESASSKVNG